MKFNLLLSRVISENLFSALKDTTKDKQVKKSDKFKVLAKKQACDKLLP